MSGIRWEAPEFEHRPKMATWYWTTIGIAVTLLSIAVWQRSFLFALFVLIGEILLITWAAEHPPTIRFELTHKGLKVGNRKFYPIREIKSFSADVEGVFDADHPDIVIHFNHHFRPAMRIKAPMIWLNEIRKELHSHDIPEEHFDPTFTEVLERYLGF